MADFIFNVPKGMKLQQVQGAPSQPPMQMPMPQHQAIELSKGEYLFVLGANGTGKSSLMLSFYGPNQQQARRIVSHRQNWFQSGAVNMTAQQRKDTGNNIQSQDASPHSRWKDDYAQQRASMAIYDLIDAENIRAREIAQAADAGDMAKVSALALKLSPLNRVNRLLQLSNLPIALSIEAGQQVMASRNGGGKYDVAELSDGERNALLIASNVLTVRAGTLLVIDEPERHLHRSIISPLLSLLFEERPDCAFIVSTHDVMLALDNPDGQMLLVRGCTHDNNKQITAWDVDLVPPGGAIDDQLMHDVLGARRKVIFIEGTQSSLDLPLYAAMFPSLSVVPKRSCVEVQRAVEGLRGAPNAAWVKAFGIIDGDGRSQPDIASLQQEGIYAVKAYSIEAVYFHPEIQRRIATAQVLVQGGDANALVSAANAATIAAVQPHIDRLAARIVERDVREKMVRLIPSHQQLVANPVVNLALNATPLLAAEKLRLTTACASGDVEAIICRYPLRETSALSDIAKAMKFQKRSDYENAVRQLLVNDDTALSFVRGLYGTMYADVTAP